MFIPIATKGKDVWMEDIYKLIRSALASQKDVQVTLDADVDGCHLFEYEGGPLALEDRCIFDECLQNVKREILRFNFSQVNCGDQFSGGVNVELAKLAAKNGNLARDEAEQCLYEGFEEERWIDNYLRVAYFGSDICYEKRLVELVEKRAGDLGDGYDGLFMACWFMNSPRVDEALSEQLACWLEQDTLDRAGCSLADVFRLVCKWEDANRNAKCGRMREVYRAYVKRQGDVTFFKKAGLW